MSNDFFDDFADAVESIRSDVDEIATARARYRVQEDYNRELVAEIVFKTGHENLAATCFVEVNLESIDGLKADIYTDDDIINGIYKSNSSFHKSGGKWTSISDHYGMSKYEFWDRKESGNEGKKGMGVVDTEWIVDNFWIGVYYATNGWPFGNSDVLSVYRYSAISAESITEAYHERYVNSNRFQQYIQEEINAMS